MKTSELVIMHMWHDLECRYKAPCSQRGNSQHLERWSRAKDPRTAALNSLVEDLAARRQTELFGGITPAAVELREANSQAGLREVREYSVKVQDLRRELRGRGVFVRRKRMLEMLKNL